MRRFSYFFTKFVIYLKFTHQMCK